MLWKSSDWHTQFTNHNANVQIVIWYWDEYHFQIWQRRWLTHCTPGVLLTSLECDSILYWQVRYCYGQAMSRFGWPLIFRLHSFAAIVVLYQEKMYPVGGVEYLNSCKIMRFGLDAFCCWPFSAFGLGLSNLFFPLKRSAFSGFTYRFFFHRSFKKLMVVRSWLSNAQK